MSLQRLTISNFKSYDGDLEIAFEQTPFVAAVGPNGSGKSNMLDAICFVVGLDLERLRCKSLKDLVHKSSRLEMSVSAHIETANGEIVVFRRTPSEFSVNNKIMKREEYSNEWAKLNVFPGARNCIVLQMDIENLARTEPEDLARLIETMQSSISVPEILSDISDYDSMEKELAEAALDSRKFISARRSAQSKINQAQDLNESKEKLNDLKYQLKKLEKRRKILVSSEKRAFLKVMREKIEQAQLEVDHHKDQVELMNVDSKKLRYEYARKRQQLQTARNHEQEAAESVIEAEGVLNPLQRKLSSLMGEQRLHNSDLEYFKQSLDTAEADFQSAERALQLLDRAHERSRNELDLSENGSSELVKSRSLWNKLESEFIAETAIKQDAIYIAKQNLDACVHRLLDNERKAEERNSELTLASSRLKQQEFRLSQLQSLLLERRNQQKECKQELESLNEKLRLLRLDQKDASHKLSEYSDKIRSADTNKQALAQRYRLLDTVERLRHSNRGVLDLLGNLVTPIEERFAVSLERGLGANADSIVVDSVETAKQCIEQAKRDRLGRYTFLPLANLESKELSTARALLARRSANGNESRLLIDCCHFDQEIRPALIHALGDTAFTPSFKEAMDLRRNGASMRIIDINGSTISSNNIVTASAGAHLESSHSASDRSVASMQRKAHTLAEKLKAGVIEENELGDREIRLGSKLERLAQIIVSTEEELATTQQQVDSSKRTVDHFEANDPLDTADLQATREAKKIAQDQLDELVNELSGARAMKFQEFVSEAGGTLAEWDAKFAYGSQRHAEFLRQRQRSEDRLKLATERRDAASSLLDAHNQRRRALESALRKTSEQQSTATEDLNAARQRLERTQSRVRDLRDEIESRSEEMGATEAAMEETRLRISAAEHAEHKYSVALAAEIDGPGEVESDYSDSADSLSDTESKASKSSRKRKRVSKAAGLDILNIDRIDNKILELKAEIEPLAALVAAIRGYGDDDEAARASQVCADLDKTAEIARSKHDLLTTRFSELRSRRASRFNNVLESLQSHLSTVYSELIGGEAQAKLTAVKSDAPFSAVEFSVMAPGKPFTHISQMSGGERSMAALALLFACQKLHPAPFIALDEVDAALDFANVASVSKYIASHSLSTQFIIVSLKQRLFQCASHLIGVYKEKASSKILTVSL